MKLLDQTAYKAFQRQWGIAKDNGWTQAKIASELGISQPSFNQYLKGVIPLNLEFILKPSSVLKITPQLLGVSSEVVRPVTASIAVRVKFSTSGLFYENGATRMVTAVPNNTDNMFLAEVDTEFRNIQKGSYLVCVKTKVKQNDLVVAVNDGRVVVGTLKRTEQGWAVIQPLTTGDIAIEIDTSWTLSKVESICFPDNDSDEEYFGA